jgi:hypothetical protein
MDFSAYLKSLKTYWPHVLQAASAICITIAGFVKPPVYFDPLASVSETKNLAVFVVAILILVFFYLAFRFSLRKHAKTWAIASVLFLLAMIAADLVFRDFRTHCICFYDGKPVLIGKQLTPIGNRDVEKKLSGVVRCEDLLMDFQGKASLIWDAQSIDNCGRSMVIAYWSTFSLAGLTVLSALQIVRSLGPQGKSKGTSRKP